MTAADVPALYELVRDCHTPVLGHGDISVADIEADVGPTSAGTDRFQALVRDRGSGWVVAWWWTDPTPGRLDLVSDVYVHPAVPDADGDALAESGWTAIEEFARHYFAAPAHGVPADRRAGAHLDCGALEGDTAAKRRLAAAGFAPVRTFWRMAAPATEAVADPAPPTGPDGMVIRVADDPRVIHRLRQQTFADHWNFQPEDLEPWLARQRALPGHDPTLWFVAEVGGEPAGFLVGSRQMAMESAFYVVSLGTLATHRRRGIAAALLRHARAVARAEGFDSVRLNVDSENPTGATSVYRRAGFEVAFAMTAWHKPLGLSASPAASD